MARVTINSDPIRPFGPTNGGIGSEFGDTWDTAVAKINAMFAELYNSSSISAGTGLQLVNGVMSIAPNGVSNGLLANPSLVLGTTTLTLGGTYSTIGGNLTFGGTVNFSGSLEVNGTPISFPVAVNQGGTGRQTLSANGVLYGAGTAGIGVTGINSTTTNKYLQQANGFPPSFAQVAFGDLSGSIALTQMNGGIGASASTFWRGDGTWAALPNYTPVTTWYVRTTGSDTTGDGMSAATAFATIKKAMTVALSYDWGGAATITINVGAGSFAGTEITGAARGAVGLANINSPYLAIVGAGAGTTQITYSAGSSTFARWCFESSGYVGLLLQDLDIIVPTNGSSNYGVFIQNWVNVYTSGTVRFLGGNSGAYGVHAEEYSLIYCLGTIKVPGTLDFLFAVGSTSMIESLGNAIDLTGGTVTTLCLLDEISLLVTGAPVLTGSTTGAPVAAASNSATRNTGANLNALSSVPSTYASGSTIYPGTTPVLGAVTGIGSTGTVSFASGSNARSGKIILTPGGTGIGNQGAVSLTLFEFYTLDGLSPSPYVVHPSYLGSGLWSSLATMLVYGNSSGVLAFDWYNNGVTLNAGQSYYIDYLTVN